MSMPEWDSAAYDRAIKQQRQREAAARRTTRGARDLYADRLLTREEMKRRRRAERHITKEEL